MSPRTDPAMLRALFVQEFRRTLLPTLGLLAGGCAAVLGIEQFVLARPGGDEGAGDLILVAGASALALMCGVRAFSLETVERNSPFLYTLPVRRGSLALSILLAHLLAYLIAVAAGLAVVLPLRPSLLDLLGWIRLTDESQDFLGAAGFAAGLATLFAVGAAGALLFRSPLAAYTAACGAALFLMRAAAWIDAYSTGFLLRTGGSGQSSYFRGTGTDGSFLIAEALVALVGLVALDVRLFARGELTLWRQRAWNLGLAAGVLGLFVVACAVLQVSGVVSGQDPWVSTALAAPDGRTVVVREWRQFHRLLGHLQFVDVETGRISERIDLPRMDGLGWWAGEAGIFVACLRGATLPQQLGLAFGTSDVLVRLDREARELGRTQLDGLLSWLEPVEGGRILLDVQDVHGGHRLGLLDARDGELHELTRTAAGQPCQSRVLRTGSRPVLGTACGERAGIWSLASPLRALPTRPGSMEPFVHVVDGTGYPSAAAGLQRLAERFPTPVLPGSGTATGGKGWFLLDPSQFDVDEATMLLYLGFDPASRKARLHHLDRAGGAWHTVVDELPCPDDLAGVPRVEVEATTGTLAPTVHTVRLGGRELMTLVPAAGIAVFPCGPAPAGHVCLYDASLQQTIELGPLDPAHPPRLQLASVPGFGGLIVSYEPARGARRGFRYLPGSGRPAPLAARPLHPLEELVAAYPDGSVLLWQTGRRLRRLATDGAEHQLWPPAATGAASFEGER